MRRLFLLAFVSVCSRLFAALVELTPLKCRGTYTLPSKNNVISSIFLSKGKLEVIENRGSTATNSVLLCDIFPIPLQNDPGKDLVYASMSEKTYSLFDVRNGCSVLLNRDKGIFDNLPYSWIKGLNCRKELYNFLNGGQGNDPFGKTCRFSDLPSHFRNPQKAFQYAVEQFLGAKVSALIIEVADEFKDAVTIGAAMVISKQQASENPVQPTSENILTQGQADDDSSVVVPCHTDELVGFALALSMPIYMQRNIFESGAIDAVMIKNPDTSEPVIAGPYRRSTNKDRKPPAPANTQKEDAVPAWDIFDPQEFIRMSVADKRATLRASNVKSLPRPREGEAALDNVLMDLADDAVRREVIRLKYLKDNAEAVAESSLDGMDTAAALGETKRQVILRQIGEALETGDMVRAEELREKFATLTALKADPTQPEGSYSRFLDQDDWYLEARRRAMAPKKKQ